MRSEQNAYPLPTQAPQNPYYQQAGTKVEAIERLIKDQIAEVLYQQGQ